MANRNLTQDDALPTDVVPLDAAMQDVMFAYGRSQGSQVKFGKLDDIIGIEVMVLHVDGPTNVDTVFGPGLAVRTHVIDQAQNELLVTIFGSRLDETTGEEKSGMGQAYRLFQDGGFREAVNTGGARPVCVFTKTVLASGVSMWAVTVTPSW